MKKVINQFVINKNSQEVIQRIGNSTIQQPKTCFCGKPIKWFDDTKLIRKGRIDYEYERF